jgi:hypothetical protein
MLQDMDEAKLEKQIEGWEKGEEDLTLLRGSRRNERNQRQTNRVTRA